MIKQLNCLKNRLGRGAKDRITTAIGGIIGLTVLIQFAGSLESVKPMLKGVPTGDLLRVQAGLVAVSLWISGDSDDEDCDDQTEK